MAGQAGVQAREGRGGAAAVLRAPQGGQEGAAGAESRGPLGGEVQRAQQGHGSQTDAAAAQGRSSGGWRPALAAARELFATSAHDLTL